MKFAKKIEIKVTVKDNLFLKEQLPYLQRNCIFRTAIENHDWYNKETELKALSDSDEFIITLEPVRHSNDELTIVNGEIQYTVQLTFERTSMAGHFYESYEPYVLLTPSEARMFIFPNALNDGFNTKASLYPMSFNIDGYINSILSMAFGLKNEEEEKFKYEII